MDSSARQLARIDVFLDEPTRLRIQKWHVPNSVLKLAQNTCFGTLTRKRTEVGFVRQALLGDRG